MISGIKNTKGIAPYVRIKNSTSGITLVALVITIIVLLILAGVTISMVLGENGIIGRASESAKVTEIASIKEQIQMEILGKDLLGNITDSELETILSKYGEVQKDNDGKITGIITDKGYEIAIEDIWSGTTVAGGDSTPREETEIIGDGQWLISKEVNSPKKTSDMTPITWNSSNVETPVTNENDWYDYDNQEWANAKTADGSYWVWIPRFAYKITGETIDIKFLQGTTNKAVDGSEVPSDYKVHPAFQDGSSKNYINGEWRTEISGIWVAKFEMSREDSSDSGATWSQTTTTGNVQTVKTGTSQIRAVSKPRSK